MQEYFATMPDPERGWALAALTGELVFDEAKPSQVRALAAARVDPELLDWSYDFVGDLAETVSLIWPAASGGASRVPSLAEIVERLRRAQPLEDSDITGLDPRDYLAEWKWDGIRVQLAARGAEKRFYSRSGDDIGAAFPDVCAAMPTDVTLDGELLVLRDGEVAPFN